MSIFGKVLFNNINKHQDKVAAEFENKNIRYKDIIKFGSKFKFLKNNKKLILIICEYNLDLISGYVNFLRYNQLVFLVGNELSKRDYENLIDRYQPQYIYIPSKNFRISGFKNFSIKLKFKNYNLLTFKKNTKYIINKNLSLLLMTSGSTGDPQTVRISSQNLIFNTNSIIKHLKIKSSDKAITTLPMNYSLGMSIINTHLEKGASINLNNYSLFEKNFWRTISSKKITTFTGVPFTYEILYKLGVTKNRLPYIKYLTQAGGKLNKKLSIFFYRELSKLKIKFHIMYGQTEASPRMSFLNHKDISKHPDSIGKPILGTNFKLLDEKRKLIKNNSLGELCFIGKNVCYGYAKSFTDLKKGDENKGVLFTGDIAYKDSDNYYYIVGRKKRFIKIAGKRISLDYIESLFKKRNIVVVCTEENERLNIFFENKSYKQNILIDILKIIGIKQSSIKVNQIKKIPRTASGKIKYNELKING